ncbi:hypothetical protein ONS95_006064 [Cadophora gregata]|uniref:uncharacterized protein n=1 Tax=Cadophora gregata TaxID=51156 RepID=UPI0026DB1F9C|nr:uncharacterized protein ONS95_006064 [Cadophora gregata]KAK0102445.1 hypothetical protein ONS95_006064 [Cadophora gregata]KAK0104072.1 hypothetical protein ONS96_005174 [Cadophora gregata f. sp. sojae]
MPCPRRGNTGESTALDHTYARYPTYDETERGGGISSFLPSSKAAPGGCNGCNQLRRKTISRFCPNGSIWSSLPLEILQKIATEMTELLTMSEVHPSLVTTLTNLAYFTIAIKENKSKRMGFLDPIIFTEDLHGIQHNLLSFSTLLPAFDNPASKVDKALGFGALLYTKSILQEFPNSVTGPSILLARLQESLSEIEFSESVVPLLAWLSLIGGVLSTGEGREWFVARLRMLMATNRTTSFQELAGGMNRLLCLRNVFENAYEDSWLEGVNKAGSNLGGKR